MLMLMMMMMLVAECGRPDTEPHDDTQPTLTGTTHNGNDLRGNGPHECLRGHRAVSQSISPVPRYARSCSPTMAAGSWSNVDTEGACRFRTVQTQHSTVNTQMQRLTALLFLRTAVDDDALPAVASLNTASLHLRSNYTYGVADVGNTAHVPLLPAIPPSGYVCVILACLPGPPSARTLRKANQTWMDGWMDRWISPPQHLLPSSPASSYSGCQSCTFDTTHTYR